MVILGLGSNIGDRRAHLRAAVQALSGALRDMQCSRVYESQAVLPAGAPAEWDVAYLNMAIRGETTLAPLALLAHIKSMEQQLGRTFRGVWAPREIDIDILAMGDMVLQTPELSIPHPRLLERDFALLPLADIAPGWHYPVAGDFYHIPVEGIVKTKAYALNTSLRNTGPL